MFRKKTALSLIVVMAMLSALMAGMTAETSANAVDKLTVKIGYYGWPAADYVEKAVFSASELYEMGPDTADYTYWDGSKRVAIDSSYGVPLATIIDAAGIDQSSIANLDFWTADSGDGAFTSFTWQQLIGTKRYYFGDLAACFYYDDDGNILCDEDEAWKNAHRVSPMMALEESWVWYEIGTADASGTDNLGTANRFRLNFGQAAPTEKRTFNSAKMVHTIYVMFSGSPKLTSKETNIDGKVGSEHQLKVTAAAADEALENAVQGNVTWSSSDTSVVEVDENGRLRYVGEGTATVYATSGGQTIEFSIRVGSKDKAPKPEEKKEEENKPASGSGNGNGDGSGSGTGNGNGNAENTGSGNTRVINADPAEADPEGMAAEKPAEPEEVKPDPKKTNTFVLSEEASRNLKLALNSQAPSEEASMSTHQVEMDEDAEQLEIKKDDSGIAGTMGLINGIIAVEGSLFGFFSYRKQRWGRILKRI